MNRIKKQKGGPLANKTKIQQCLIILKVLAKDQGYDLKTMKKKGPTSAELAKKFKKAMKDCAKATANLERLVRKWEEEDAALAAEDQEE